MCLNKCCLSQQTFHILIFNYFGHTVLIPICGVPSNITVVSTLLKVTTLVQLIRLDAFYCFGATGICRANRGNMISCGAVKDGTLGLGLICWLIFQEVSALVSSQNMGK